MARKIVATQYISLDGVIEDPVGMENTGLGDWTGPYSRGPEGDRLKHQELFDADAVLLGRLTYDGFAAVWPQVTDETGFARRINDLPKYVASRTLREASWNNTTVFSDNAVEAVRELREGPGADIIVYGSASLLHDLMEADLVDAYNLMVYPVTLGCGKKLFPDGYSASLKLTEQQLLGTGIMWLRYELARDEATG
jgi:dihydrofolate reductase